MPISQEKKAALELRMKELEIREEDLIEQFILGSGKGGQKLNKTSSCVYLKHKPTQLEVKCQKERSRDMNRFFARRTLCDLYEEKVLGVKSKAALEEEKRKKQKARRARRSQEKYGEAEQESM